jgi:hypothetical protein
LDCSYCYSARDIEAAFLEALEEEEEEEEAVVPPKLAHSR